MVIPPKNGLQVDNLCQFAEIDGWCIAPRLDSRTHKNTLLLVTIPSIMRGSWVSRRRKLPEQPNLHGYLLKIYKGGRSPESLNLFINFVNRGTGITCHITAVDQKTAAGLSTSPGKESLWPHLSQRFPVGQRCCPWSCPQEMEELCQLNRSEMGISSLLNPHIGLSFNTIYCLI